MNLEGFEILEKIAEGQSGIFWKAMQTAQNRMTVIKTPKEGCGVHDAERMQRRLEEAKTAAQVDHPGIAKIHDIIDVGGKIHVVSEFINGENLIAILNEKGRLEEKQVLTIAGEIAFALKQARNQTHLIHFDLKPENIMLDRNEHTKILDFGTVRLFGGKNRELKQNHVIGTPNYVAPEQIRGDGAIDERSDIYSLGAILYHLLTGIVPFYRMKPDEICDRQLHDTLPDLYIRNPNLSTGLYWLVEKMLAKDPENRYADWSEFIEDLNRVRSGLLTAKVLPADKSTLERSPDRPRKPGSSAGTKPASSGTPGKVVIVSADAAERNKPLEMKHYTPKTFKTVNILLFLLLVGGAGAFVIMKSMQQSKAPEPELPDLSSMPPQFAVVEPSTLSFPDFPDPEPMQNTTVPEPFTPVDDKPDEPEFLPPEIVVPPPPAPGTQPPEPTRPTNRTWTDPTFKRGVGHLRNAEGQYLNYLRTRKNPEGLNRAESEARTAVAEFEKVRDQAPFPEGIDELIRKSNMLIYNIRKSKPL